VIGHTLKLKLDLSKRHFVVGDIHGRFDAFLDLLKAANYNPDNDIIYSVGDLIDRGPKSYEAFNFFRENKNCFAIKGNHEHMPTTIEWYMTWIQNGGNETLNSLDEHNKTIEWLKTEIHRMPWCIEVGEDDDEHAFRVVHAEMPPEWSDEYFRKMLGESLTPEDPTFMHILWSRRTISRLQENIKEDLPLNVSINFHPDRSRNNFCGHTPTRDVMHIGDLWWVDTWRSGTMSMIDAVTKEIYTVKAS